VIIAVKLKSQGDMFTYQGGDVSKGAAGALIHHEGSERGKVNCGPERT